MEYTDIELKNEQWRDIDGYYGAYQVSDLGRVRSLKYGKTRVLRPRKEKNGYLRLILWKDGKRKDFSVHRLVAQAFIDNDDETKIYINHRNECKSDNRLWNLEYCTPQYNTNYNDVQFRKKNSKRRKIKDIYDPELSIDDNIELFRANGIECSEKTVYQLRKELGLTKQCEPKRDKVKELYDPKLSIQQNLEIFKSNGISCSRSTVLRLRKDLGLIK